MRVPLWAKLVREGTALPHAWHSLIDHSADVAEVFEAILRLPIVKARLAALAGKSCMPEVWLDRVAVTGRCMISGRPILGFRRAGRPMRLQSDMWGQLWV